MGIFTETEIPNLQLSKIHYTDGNQRENFCKRIRESCETYGCFLLTCPEIIPSSLVQDMMLSLKSLFDLPEETKLRFQNPRPYRGYVNGNPIVPLHESFGGIEEAWSPEVARRFTQLMWPQGNQHFCETLKSMSGKMRDLSFTIMGMICESFGLEKRHCDPLLEDSTSVTRLMKYNVPQSGSDESALGLVPHTDKSFLTVLSQNDVQGLEVVTRDGRWIPVSIPHDAFVVIIGDALQAWSNGRLTAVKHRVMINAAGKERYSAGVFTVPNDDAEIKVPNELLRHDHNSPPLLYRPFKFCDYFSYFISNVSDDALDRFAGVPQS